MAEEVIVYPGSFDPVTYGHLDLIRRGIKIFNRVIVAVLSNPFKESFFPLVERLTMLREATQDIPGEFEIDAFDGLLIHYMREKQIRLVLRGLRAVSDFEYEFEMALTNRRLSGEVETIFMAPSENYIYLRASLVKEIALRGGNVGEFVPPNVERRLLARYREMHAMS